VEGADSRCPANHHVTCKKRHRQTAAATTTQRAGAPPKRPATHRANHLAAPTKSANAPPTATGRTPDPSGPASTANPASNPQARPATASPADTQPRTVEHGRPTNPAALRHPIPPATASNTHATTNPPSARRDSRSASEIGDQ
jgi:hypothetical protein